jgi:hypothetical protein
MTYFRKTIRKNGTHRDRLVQHLPLEKDESQPDGKA